MGKSFTFAILLLFASASNASSLSATGYFNSNYIYKGLSFTNGGPFDAASNGKPAIQGSLDFTHSWFGLTLFTGNVNSWDAITFLPEPDIEIDAMMFAVIPIQEFVLQLNVNAFTYIANPINNTMDFAAKVMYQDMKVTLSVTPMLGWETNLGYAQFAYCPKFTEEFYLNTHLGYNYISNTNWGYSSYFDYKLGLLYVNEGWYGELYYTNTFLRKNFSTDEYFTIDGALTVSVGKTFAIF